MKLISQKEYEKLKEKYEKRFGNYQTEKKWRKEWDEREEEHEEEIEDLNNAHARELRKAARDAVKANEADREKVKELEAINAELTKKVTSGVELVKREMALNEREVIVAAREKAADKDEKAVEALRVKTEKQLEVERKRNADLLEGEKGAFYKKGYADGLSDGVREGATNTDKAQERAFGLAEKAITKDSPAVNVLPLNTTVNNNQAQ